MLLPASITVRSRRQRSARPPCSPGSRAGRERRSSIRALETLAKPGLIAAGGLDQKRADATSTAATARADSAALISARARSRLRHRARADRRKERQPARPRRRSREGQRPHESVGHDQSDPSDPRALQRPAVRPSRAPARRQRDARGRGATAIDDSTWTRRPAHVRGQSGGTRTAAPVSSSRAEFANRKRAGEDELRGRASSCASRLRAFHEQADRDDLCAGGRRAAASQGCGLLRMRQVKAVHHRGDPAGAASGARGARSGS